MTIREALTHATAHFGASPELHVDAARDATLLLLHTLGITRASLLAEPGRPLTLDQQTAYDAAIRRRLTHEPIQYITGEQEFYGFALRVTPDVLIPRPETEQLVEQVLRELNATEPLRLLDVGTGSGAIAIVLAHHLPLAQVTALDLSTTALGVAAANAARYQLGKRIRFIESDLLEALAGDESLFDAIVSNPPYVPDADRDSLHPQVRNHEPSSALFAGPNGLDIYRRLIPQARTALRPNGLLALEIGHGQRDAMAALLADWNQLHFVDDLQRIPRVALARRP